MLVVTYMYLYFFPSYFLIKIIFTFADQLLHDFCPGLGSSFAFCFPFSSHANWVYILY